MNSFFLLNMVLASSVAGVEPAPVPDFHKPVDYMAWYDAQLRPARQANAMDDYSAFLYIKAPLTAEGMTASELDAARGQLDALLADPRPKQRDQNPELQKWIDALEPVHFKSFLNGAKKPHFALMRAPDVKLLVDVRPPDLANGNTVARLLFARAWRMPGPFVNPKNFIEALEANLAYANHLHQGLTLTEQFVADGHYMRIADQIQTVLHHAYSSPRLSKPILPMLAILERHDAIPLTQRYAPSVCFSEAAALQLLQSCVESGADGKPVVDADVVRARFLASNRHVSSRSLSALEGADAAKLADTMHAYYDRVRKLLTQQAQPDLQSRMHAIGIATIEAQPGVKAFMTPVGLQVQAVVESETRRRMMHLVARMIAHRNKTGGWPASLDVLKGTDMATCRIDPFSGKDFRLLELPGGSTVYSVGPDGDDDGGSLSHDLVYWP